MRKVREEFLRPSRRLTLRSLREMYSARFTQSREGIRKAR
jgi:hypothetical protein